MFTYLQSLSLSLGPPWIGLRVLVFVRTDAIQSEMIHFGHSDYTQVATQGLRPLDLYGSQSMLCSEFGWFCCKQMLLLSPLVGCLLLFACLLVVALVGGCVVVFVLGSCLLGSC